MSTMLLNRKTSVDPAVHRQNVQVLLGKIAEADAILVGAAAGMSASCGFNFFYQNDAIFEQYLGDFHRKYGFIGAFNGFYYRYPSRRPTGPSWPGWVTWSMNVPQASPIMT